MKSLKINAVSIALLALFMAGQAWAQAPNQSNSRYYYTQKNGKVIRMKPYTDSTDLAKTTTSVIELTGEKMAPEPDTIVGQYDSSYYDFEYTSRINRFHRDLGGSYWMWDPYWDLYFGWGPYWGWDCCWCFDDWYCYDYYPYYGYDPYHHYGLPGGYAYYDRHNTKGHDQITSPGKILPGNATTHAPSTAGGKSYVKPSRLSQQRQLTTACRTSQSRATFGGSTSDNQRSYAQFGGRSGSSSYYSDGTRSHGNRTYSTSDGSSYSNPRSYDSGSSYRSSSSSYSPRSSSSSFSSSSSSSSRSFSSGSSSRSCSFSGGSSSRSFSSGSSSHSSSSTHSSVGGSHRR